MALADCGDGGEGSDPPCWRPIRPVFGCVSQNPDGSYSADWGYISENASCCPDVIIPVGEPLPGVYPISYFSPAPIDRGQPTVFGSGEHRDVFSITWDGSPLTWTIRSVAFVPPLFYREFSATASLENLGENCPNEPPVCNIGGPYLQECGGVETNIQLDGSASWDPEGMPLDYQWQVVCLKPASIVGGDTATPIVTLFEPGQGKPTNCQVHLTVSDGSLQSSCSTTIDVPACILDCLGEPFGVAVLDACGVCDGKNECFDCAGVPFGTAKVDRCGKCEGDGTSCLGCVATNNTNDLNEMLKKSINQRDINTILISLGPSGSQTISLDVSNQKAFERALAFLKQLPPETLACSNLDFCATSSSYEIEQSKYQRWIRKLYRISLESFDLVLNSKDDGKCTRSREECEKDLAGFFVRLNRLKLRAKVNYKRNLKLSKKISVSSMSCT